MSEKLRLLTTSRQVIDVLGGSVPVAELTEGNVKDVSNWRTKFGMFPANTYCVMRLELFARGYYAPPYLWNMRGFEKPRQKRKTPPKRG